MLKNDMVSLEQGWADLAKKWNYEGSADKLIKDFRECLANANSAIAEIDVLGDCGSLTVNVTEAQITDLDDKRGKMLAFCDQIHYEAVKDLDNPFSQTMGNLAERAYALDPTALCLDADKRAIKTDVMSLAYAVAITMTDPKLQNSFINKVTELEDSKIANKKRLNDAINDSKWQKEYIDMIEKAKANYPDAIWGSGLINNQRDYTWFNGTFGPWGSVGGNSCGIIAMHNVNVILGLPSKFEDTDFIANKGWLGTTVLGGLMGTNPLATKLTYDMMGCDTKVYLDPSKVDNTHDAYITLYFYKGSNGLPSAHYVASVYDKDKGAYITYNDDYSGRGTMEYSNFDKMYEHDNAIGMIVMGIDKP